MSLPNGLRFKTQKHNLEPEFHSFIVTKQNGERCYGHSLIFYEKAPNKICSAMQTLQVNFDSISVLVKMVSDCFFGDHFSTNNLSETDVDLFFEPTKKNHDKLGLPQVEFPKNTIYTLVNIQFRNFPKK